MIKKNKKGFTLMELLIVIFIITLIGTLVTVYFFQIRKNVRDSKRLSDISEIQLALENYKFFEGQYPDELIPGEPLIGSTTGKVFLNKTPQNPDYYNSSCSSNNYDYHYDDSSEDYKISFCLEGGFESYNSGPKCAFMGEIFEGNCLFCPSYVSDIDGNIYEIVAIGDQCWFKENLNLGIRINRSINQEDNGITEKYCYNDDENNCDIYGGLYHWNEAMNYSDEERSQGLCPDGWHIPTDEEFTILERAVCVMIGNDVSSCEIAFPIDDPIFPSFRGSLEGYQLKHGNFAWW